MFVQSSQRNHIHVVDFKDGVRNWVYGKQIYKNTLKKMYNIYKKL